MSSQSFKRLVAPVVHEYGLPPQGIRNRWLNAALVILPWLIAATIVHDVFLFGAWRITPLGNEIMSSDIRFVVSEIAVILSLLAFRVLMRMIPEVLDSLWSRACIALPLDVSTADTAPETERKNLAARYGGFLQEMDRHLNHAGGFLLSAGLLLIFADRMASDCGGWENFISNIPARRCVGIPDLLFEVVVSVVLGLMIWRMLIVAIKVSQIERRFDLVVQFNHPDNCGGLEPLGNLCLWNALIVSIFGILTTVLFFIEIPLGSPHRVFYLELLLVVVILAPIVFILPLWNVHRAMLRDKRAVQRELDELGKKINALSRDLVEQADALDPDESAKLAKKIQVLEEIYRANQEIPAWPINLPILTKFATAQIVPLLGLTGFGQPIVRWVESLLGGLSK